jgi:hypothetical protein
MGAFAHGADGLESGAYTASQDFEFAPWDAVGVIVVIDATAKASTPSVVFTVQGYDEISGKWYDILASTAVTDVSTTKLVVDPRVTVAANAAAAHPLVPKMRVHAVAADSDALTYSIGITYTS